MSWDAVSWGCAIGPWWLLDRGMVEMALARHPRGRLTTPEDVAQVLVALSAPGCGWLTGNVIQVDGGEGLVA